jgi:very-short-patch-repair endonuclease
VKNIKPLPLKGGVGVGAMKKRIIGCNRNALLKHAKEMRNNPTEPEKRLWRHLSNAQLGGYKFRRQTVIDNFIVDFYCPSVGLIVEVDGDTHDRERDLMRDDLLGRRFGLRTCRVSNHEVITNMDGVLELILACCESDDALTHPNPSLEREGL